MAKTDGMTHPGENDCYPQKLGDQNNLQGNSYNNDTSGWVRGMGPQSPYPNFDSTSKRLAGGKHRDTP